MNPSGRAPVAMSLCGFDPMRIGNGEHLQRELSRQLGQLGWRTVLCFAAAPPEPIRQFLQLPNVDIEVVPESWQWGWQPAAKLREHLRKYRPRILHLHFTGFLSPYPLLAKTCGVEKVFYTDHTSHPAEYQPHRAVTWKRVAARLINAPLTAAICVSDYGYRTLQTLDLIDSSRIRRIYNGIETRTPDGSEARGAAFRKQFAIPEDRELVVQVSWLIPEKGVGDLLEAAREVIAQRPTTHFAIVGDGRDRARFEAQAREAGIASHVTFTGLIQDPFAAGVYAAADIVCQVSRWNEVFGCTITEAMAVRRPLVATEVGGIPELVHHEETGLLAPRGDSAAIAAHLLRLLDDPALRGRMGEAGRARCVEHFDLEKNVAKLIDLYGARQ